MIDSQINRKVAEQKAHQIDLDILSHNFDPTLRKYTPENGRDEEKTNLITVGELIQQFIENKAKVVSTPRSLEKYQVLLRHLQSFPCKNGGKEEFLSDKPVESLGSVYAEQFYAYLADRLTPLILKQSLVWLSACWQWGIKNHLAETDPWFVLTERVKVPPKQMPKPFTKAEVRTIIEGFRSDRYYSHYSDFVEFLFGTGY